MCLITPLTGAPDGKGAWRSPQTTPYWPLSSDGPFNDRRRGQRAATIQDALFDKNKMATHKSGNLATWLSCHSLVNTVELAQP